MTPPTFARLASGRVHYAWIVLVVMFTATLAGVGVRAAPGVMIVPLQRVFGWDVGTISAAISINIILMGALGAALSVAAMVPIVGLLLPESPAQIGIAPYGSDAVLQPPPRAGNPFSIALTVLLRASRSADFWLLTLSFAVCGFSTNGLI